MKRIARVARTASYQQTCHPRQRNPAFDPTRRRISSTATRNAKKKAASDEEDTAASSPATPADGQPESVSDLVRNKLFAKAPLGGWDGRHLPKSMPDGWKEAMDEYGKGLGENPNDPDAGTNIDVNNLTPAQAQYFEYLRLGDEAVEREMEANPRLRRETKEADDFLGGQEPPYPRDGFWAHNEDKDDPGPDFEFNNDDITSMAHAELEQHRELRELARAAVWDMPLLWNHRQEFNPPTSAQILRFRYTTYLGEFHPAASKVVVDFPPAEYPGLSQVQVSKLIKLLGVRYNPSTKWAKMSCERFETAAQNKRYLGDLIDKLVTEAKDPTDTFEDVPFDFRHHKPRTKLEFPQEWKMTAERRAELQAKWAAKDGAEIRAADEGSLVQGAMLVQQLAAPAAEKEQQVRQREMETVNVPASRGRARR